MNKIETLLKNKIIEAVFSSFHIELNDDYIVIEIPKDSNNGDYSTNIAMKITKSVKQKPRATAEILVGKLNEICDFTEKIEVAGVGFINFFIKNEILTEIINTVIAAKDNYGENQSGNNLKILVEYVSANPTGPLHCGHARGAAWGDAICRLLKKSGYDCLREYYINDAGNQIDMLGESIYGRYRQYFGLDFSIPDDGYHGQDIIEITEEIISEIGDRYLHCDKNEALDFFKWEGRNRELKRIKEDLAYYGCEFDSWISEQWIVNENRVIQVFEKINSMGLTYHQDDAVWFKSTDYGDDKDRVLKKSDGTYTYLMPDIANHQYKFERGYEKLVNLWGADHHGYVARVKAAMKALGHPEDALEIDLIQMVRLVEDGLEVKMSKRTGNAITIRELIDEVGLDAARYFFVSKAVDTHLDFDFNLAKSETNDNPVYYAQYAYARICSVLRQQPAKALDSYSLLNCEKEIALLKHIGQFTSVVADAAKTRSPNKMCNYIQKLAQYFHSFYASNKIWDENNLQLSKERLALVEATRVTLKNALNLVGVSSPERM
ncbi:MAG: arginine--tRNA ligase [Erysipelotrichaceae bacterium]|jgi:arginyl-tRNA synthetase